MNIKSFFVAHLSTLTPRALTCPHHLELHCFQSTYLTTVVTFSASVSDQRWMYVQGCDASILIAPTATAGDAAARPKVERDMEENRNLPQEAFDTVEMAKAAVESKCPGVVTCADVLALAARDFVQLVRAFCPCPINPRLFPLFGSCENACIYRRAQTEQSSRSNCASTVVCNRKQKQADTVGFQREKRPRKYAASHETPNCQSWCASFLKQKLVCESGPGRSAAGRGKKFTCSALLCFACG